jgi:hypothetical protein
VVVTASVEARNWIRQCAHSRRYGAESSGRCTYESSDSVNARRDFRPWIDVTPQLIMESMATHATEEADIGFVRHQLDVLVEGRCIIGWSLADQGCYEELCVLERSLLGAARASA